MISSKKKLELIIQKVPGFKNPKIELEQYVTDASIVAEIVWTSHMSRELINAKVLDLGCGTGRFAIAAALLNASEVLCVDIDKDALSIAKKVSREFKLDNVIDHLCEDVLKLKISKKFDIVFQNPPFGIQSRRGLDIDFLKIATEYGDIVYSIHKLETIDYVISKVNEWSLKAKILTAKRINIPLMYGHHRKRIHKVDVGIIKIYK